MSVAQVKVQHVTMLEAVIDLARNEGRRRVRLATSNDNLGLRLVTVQPGAIDEARTIKPSIPPVGNYGIPIRDELEFELKLDG